LDGSQAAHQRLGDAAQWWAYYLIALAAGGWWTIYGPIVMTTSALILWFPRQQ
jgi:steroid 5-alpha reductase family enzyme